MFTRAVAVSTYSVSMTVTRLNFKFKLAGVDALSCYMSLQDVHLLGSNHHTVQ